MRPPAAPTLILVAHGTRSGKGVEMIAALAEAVQQDLRRAPHPPCGHRTAAPASDVRNSMSPSEVRRRSPLGGTPARLLCSCSGEPVAPAPQVRTAFVDVLGPSPAEVLRDIDGPAVLVPAFLASGYHVYQDVPREIAESGHPQVTVTPAMGPDPALARTMTLRLRAAGWHPGDAVVFAAAGSSDPRARADIRRAAAMLTACTATSVRTAYVATGTPKVPEVVAQLRDSGHERIFIASYLLAHGLFHERLHLAGATGVADPIGTHPAVVRLLADRYRTAAHNHLATH